MNFPFGYNKDCTTKEQILAKVREAILEKDEKHFSDINLQDDTWIPFKEEDGKEFTFIERFKENGGIFMSGTHCLQQVLRLRRFSLTPTSFFKMIIII